jgi:hypothetical protein
MDEKIKCTLEVVLESLRRPTYCHLEIGFRHTPLSQKEIIERYEETCILAARYIEELLKEINKVEG